LDRLISVKVHLRAPTADIDDRKRELPAEVRVDWRFSAGRAHGGPESVPDLIGAREDASYDSGEGTGWDRISER
jgi:hypothetical protein